MCTDRVISMRSFATLRMTSETSSIEIPAIRAGTAVGPSSARVAHPATVAATAAILATVAAYGWLLAPQLGKPFVYDDVNFALGAEAVARTGLPFGNQGYLLHLYEQREQWALWHPPLYIYALGLTMALFGSSEAALRSLGIACQVLAAGLTFDLARRLAVMRDEPRATSDARSDHPCWPAPWPWRSSSSPPSTSRRRSCWTSTTPS
jgi:hypothetical protein